jgi:hypothetical protein
MIDTFHFDFFKVKIMVVVKALTKGTLSNNNEMKSHVYVRVVLAYTRKFCIGYISNFHGYMHASTSMA